MAQFIIDWCIYKYYFGNYIAVITNFILNGVDGGTILEPNDKEIVSQYIGSDNIYHRIVCVMKQSTQEYYNMRIVLGLQVA